MHCNGKLLAWGELDLSRLAPVATGFNATFLAYLVSMSPHDVSYAWQLNYVLTGDIPSLSSQED